MSIYLYRLGRFVARRAWAVVILWALVLAGGVGAAGLWSRPFATTLTIPGTEFQQVIDDLNSSMPESAGGSGIVVFATENGEAFTQTQREKIADTLTQWRELDGVVSTLDPFTTQKELDDGVAKVADGKKELESARAEIRDNRRKLDNAKSELEAGAEKVDESAAKLNTGNVQVAEGQEKVAEGQHTIDEKSVELADGAARIEKNALEVENGRARLAAAEKELADGERRIEENAAALTAGRRELAVNRKQLTDGEREARAGRAQVEAGKVELDKARDELARQEEALAQAEENGVPLPPEQAAALAAAREDLNAQAATLAESERTVARSEAALETGRKELQAGEARIKEGERQLVAARARAKAGRTEIAAGSKRLAQGEEQLRAARTAIADGDRQLAAAQLEASTGSLNAARGAVTVAKGEIDLEQGRVNVRDGEKELAQGHARLAEAQKKVAAAAADLTRGERRLALITGFRTVTADGSTAVATITFDTPVNGIAPRTLGDIRERGERLDGSGVRVDYSQDLNSATAGLVGPGEAVGLVIAAIVLLVMLGSLVAAGLPILTALVGVGVGLAGVIAATHWYSMSSVTPILALMLGLAVGIDYALFIVNRHRTQMMTGVNVDESIGRATGTAGNAVLVAGLTVIVALAALQFSGIPFLGTMGIAAAVTVAVVLLVALTLTPAVLSLVGFRVLPRRARRRLREGKPLDAAAEDHGVATGNRWVGWITRHRAIAVVASTVLLGTLALPALSLRLGLPDGGAEPADSSAYRTYTTISEQFGPGQNAGILAVARLDGATAKALEDDELTDLQLDIGEDLHDTPGVHYVIPAGTNKDRTRLLFQVIPTSGPSDQETIDLVDRLRDERASILDATGVRSLNFAGPTVANIDISQRLSEAMPTYLLIVVGISLLLLLMVFRSVVVPVLATAGFLLSMAAAFGCVVAAYQWGWGGALLGADNPHPILSFLPMLAIGVLFGLAMDYQMFLVSGMREAWAEGEDARTAVKTGFSAGAKVVTAAALIMASVFGSFVFSPSTMIRPIGFTLALGVLFDAFVVRMTIMPALMHWLGERAWYLPRGLDGVLPDLDVEGSRLRHALEPKGTETRTRQMPAVTDE